MNRSHDELREALGSYALGQLDDLDLRRDLEEHLTTCAECRADLAEIGPLAPLLRGVRPEDVRPVGITTPAGLDERIRRALPSPERGSRRWAPAVAGLLVGAAAVTGVVLVLPDEAPPAGPTIIAVPKVDSVAGVTASAGLVDHTWGLEIKLTATGLPAGQPYEMWVIADDGTTYDAGRFVGVKGVTINCNMSTSLLFRDAKSFEVVDQDGDEVISGDLPS